MNTKNQYAKKYRYGHSEGYEQRTQRRLQSDLGIDEAAAETILHLRSQVFELQAQIIRLETELNVHHASQQMRLAHYREIYEEATWIELDIQD